MDSLWLIPTDKEMLLETLKYNIEAPTKAVVLFFSVDINECDPAKELDRCNQICKNTPGSYKCSCEKGFELKKDGYECEGK